MIVEIKKGDSPEKIGKELKKITERSTEKKKKDLEKYFGVIELATDPVTLQRKWRDEW